MKRKSQWMRVWDTTKTLGRGNKWESNERVCLCYLLRELSWLTVGMSWARLASAALWLGITEVWWEGPPGPLWLLTLRDGESGFGVEDTDDAEMWVGERGRESSYLRREPKCDGNRSAIFFYTWYLKKHSKTGRNRYQNVRWKTFHLLSKATDVLMPFKPFWGTGQKLNLASM